MCWAATHRTLGVFRVTKILLRFPCHTITYQLLYKRKKFNNISLMGGTCTLLINIKKTSTSKKKPRYEPTIFTASSGDYQYYDLAVGTTSRGDYLFLSYIHYITQYIKF